MTALRTIRPLTQQATRLAVRPSVGSFVTRRALNTDSILSTSQAHITGGRVGEAKAENFDIGLALPKSLGGSGEKGKTNPEELFAAGYGACFLGAMRGLAGKQKIKLPDETAIDATVQLLGSVKDLDFGLKVTLKIVAPGMDEQEIMALGKKTKEVCAYSRATKGNVITDVEVEV